MQQSPAITDLTSSLTADKKWNTPKRPASNVPQKNTSLSFISQNKFEVLSNDNDNNIHDKENISKVDFTCTSNLSGEQRNNNKRVKLPKDTNIINLSDPILTSAEVYVLELALGFCPSNKTFSKEELANDFFNFIQRLKLREYFYDNSEDDGINSTVSDDPEKSELKWPLRNADWYLSDVQKGRSTQLTSFIKDILLNTKKLLLNNSSKIWNNLDNDQQEALERLSTDSSIIIKPSDKCGFIVIMNKNDYEKACIEVLENKNVYEELELNPNSEYREQVDKVLNDLLLNGLINKKEYSVMTEGSDTPSFYALPKTHKTYFDFPPLRPITSGSGCCTKCISEFVDSFLKPAAQKCRSYIRDTTDFIIKTKSFKINKKDKPVFLVSMDVVSLYPNIDHTEKISACEYFMNKRNNQSFPTRIIIQLISLILQSNTMEFRGRYFHQISGTAMDTPMAVNFANLFMSQFKELLLSLYNEQFFKLPSLWLRYIDDVFFVWEGDEQSLKMFLKFCNEFSKNKNMKSNIQFTYDISAKSVNFLDTTVMLEQNGNLTTKLYSKPTALHLYLHSSSFLPPHLIKSLPKSQFIRKRRICTHKKDYWFHAKTFISFYHKRGYKHKLLQSYALNISKIDRNNLLVNKTKPNSSRIPLVITWHNQLSHVSKIVSSAYKYMVKCHPKMREKYPEPPIVTYQRPKNIKSFLVKSNHWKNFIRPEDVAPASQRFYITPNMNPSKTVTNRLSKKSCEIEGRQPTDSNVVYSAECLKHNLIYIGQTSDPLHRRFNGH